MASPSPANPVNHASCGGGTNAQARFTLRHGVRKLTSTKPASSGLRDHGPVLPLFDNKREECVMRHPFYMDHLGRQERRKVRHLLLRIFVAYLSLTVILAGATMVRVKFDPPAGSTGQNADVR
ncbi:MAG TPA: hypothetical protein VGQ63_19235 [Pseudolabrys sp.]|nr:hypothetical protein [Pseudolabrys sp.]